MHWNGKRWGRQAGVPKVHGWLNAVAVAGGSVWAVGETSGKDGHGTPLILHETGGQWYVVPNGGPPSGALWTVAATGPATVWAGGAGGASYSDLAWSTVLLRWNGSVWKAAPSPLQGKYNDLTDIAAGPHGTAWAVGFGDEGRPEYPLAMSWNGKAWRAVPVSIAPSGWLQAVTFVPGGTAWAIGSSGAGNLALDWLGFTWAGIAAPDVSGGPNFLQGVAATSPGDAWSVGWVYENPLPGQTHLQSKTVILHWNGKAWS